MKHSDRDVSKAPHGKDLVLIDTPMSATPGLTSLCEKSRQQRGSYDLVRAHHLKMGRKGGATPPP